MHQPQMLSDLETGQFRAFGFVVLRQCLSAAEVERLQEAHDRTLALAPAYDYFGSNGTRMLCPFVQQDECFGALIEHPGVMAAMREIWGAECLYTAGSDAWANLDDTPWHTDGQPGREAVTLKIAVYLDEQGAGSGALNVIPGSHHPQFCAGLFRACGYWDQGRPRLHLPADRIPGAVSIHTCPGDVVLWDNRLWHSAFRRRDGRPRRTLFIGYMPDPGGDLLALAALRAAVSSQLGERQPAVYSREMMAAGNPRRERMARRLEEVGVERVREPERRAP